MKRLLIIALLFSASISFAQSTNVDITGAFGYRFGNTMQSARARLARSNVQYTCEQIPNFARLSNIKYHDNRFGIEGNVILSFFDFKLYMISFSKFDYQIRSNGYTNKMHRTNYRNILLKINSVYDLPTRVETLERDVTRDMNTIYSLLYYEGMYDYEKFTWIRRDKTIEAQLSQFYNINGDIIIMFIDNSVRSAIDNYKHSVIGDGF